jgi:NitT/TauT family transport system substrate-binding protein
LDATYVGPNPAVNAFVRSGGEAVRVIAGGTSGGASLVVRPGINGPQDLVGKKIASPQLGNTQDVALRVWLSAQGLKSDTLGGGDVAVLPQDNGQTLEGFRSGALDGGWVPEPWATRMVQEAGGRVLVDERDLWPNGDFVTTQLVVRTEFLKAEPQIVEALVRGHVDATAFIEKNPEAAQAAVSTALLRITGQQQDAGLIAAAWGKMRFTNDPVASSLRKSASDAQSLGFVNLGGANLSTLYDLGILNKVLRESGKPEVQS